MYHPTGGSMRDEEVIAAAMNMVLRWSLLVCVISVINLTEF
jgi:hypothetical protein